MKSTLHRVFALTSLMILSILISMLGLKSLHVGMISASKLEQQSIRATDNHCAKNRFSSLPSGWNSSGFFLYEKTRTDLAKSLVRNPQAVQSHRVLPIGHVKTTGRTNWWKDNLGNGEAPPKWEQSTFINFFKHLSGCRYYVGFGTWIGPTLLYAAQLVDEAYGIEADPVAFAHVEVNLALNRDKVWASHTYLNHHAVGLGSEEWNPNPSNIRMASAGAGNSCSAVDNVGCGTPKDFWQVNAFQLPYLLRRWNVPATKDLFIKIDVESFECQLLPSWLPWLNTIDGPNKPIFHVAFHSQIVSCSTEEYRQIYKFASLFQFVDGVCMDKVRQEWAEQCHTGEYMFFDSP